MAAGRVAALSMADAMASAEEVQLGVDGTAPLEEEEGPKLTPEQLAQAIQADARQRRLDQQAWWQERQRERFQRMSDSSDATPQAPVPDVVQRRSSRCAAPETTSTWDGDLADDWPTDPFDLLLSCMCLDLIVETPNPRECARCCACGRYRCAVPRWIFYVCLEGVCAKPEADVVVARPVVPPLAEKPAG